MNSEQITLDSYNENVDEVKFSFSPDILLVFAGSAILKRKTLAGLLKQKFKDSIITGCSTAGEIRGENVSNNTVVITAVKFEQTKLIKKSIDLDDTSASLMAGEKLMSKFNKEGLKHILVLSNGLNINGTQLVLGMRSVMDDVSITGGLAGGGTSFENTYIIDDAEIKEKAVVAVGFYGEALKVGYGSSIGWESYGLDMLVTKSEGNVLYELDGKPALELYKTFLGEQAKGLPATGLLFPLSIRIDENDSHVVRTITAVDEIEQSLIFAGDIQQGAYAKLMKAEVGTLIAGTKNVAIKSIAENKNPELAILISCIGRKLMLKQLVKEEINTVRNVVGDATTITGFYSYGEIAPLVKNAKCELQNQAMTITTFSES